MARQARQKFLRCAIYTRKSSEEGLEQDFNSLHAQREACEAYVLSQRHEGWQMLPARYDDGGYSGGNIERPGLKQLLTDVRARKIDVVVVYKVDRLTRALADFAKIVDIFDGCGVSFVSVTQQFNTTSSMGRLTLNVLLSFAQFEREVTGERIRDKIAASKKKGMWMGGVVPLGYRAKDRTLTVDDAEAELVREIFWLYLDLGTVGQLQEELHRRQIRTKRYVTVTGRVVGDLPFSRGHLYKFLSNPLYLGEIQHRETRYPGLHPAIVDRATWDKVQAQLAANTHARRNGTSAAYPSLLAGLLFDEHGNRFVTTHATKNGKRYRYYVCEPPAEDDNGGPRPAVLRLPAAELEKAAVAGVVSALRDERMLLDQLGQLGLQMPEIRAALAEAKCVAAEVEGAGTASLRAVMTRIVYRIEVAGTAIRLDLRCGGLFGMSQSDATGASRRETEEKFSVVCPFECPARDGALSMMIEGAAEDAATRTQKNAADVKSVAQGYAWFEELTTGRVRSMEGIAERENITDRYVAKQIEEMLSASLTTICPSGPRLPI